MEDSVKADHVAPFDPLSLADHHAAERRLAEVRGRCPVSQPHPRMHFVAAHQDVERILLDTTTFSARSNFRLDPVNGAEGARPSGSLPTLDPPDHANVRRRLREWFAPRTLRLLEPRVRELAAAAVLELPVGVDFDLVPTSKRMATRVVYALIGAPQEDWVQLQAWSDVLHKYLPAPLQGTPEYIAMMNRLGEVLEEYRAGLRAADDTVVSGLAAAVEAGDLAPADALTHIWQLIQAGTETTISLITNLVHALLSRHRQWQLLLDRPELVGAAIEESLRRDAPLQYVMRTPHHATDVSGCPVEYDEQVVVGLQSANWDESVWGPDALEFDIERDHPTGHVAFGKGPHACLGAPLARIEAQAFIRELLSRRSEIRLATGYVHELANELMVRRPERLLLHIPG
ncbi:MAG: cytochrome [Amycolatopsis sp.]|uniref:cytochrome P450 n=1 Tax=Amycolatopsis sp. TaxID=37632 RepID=UPI002626DAFE|nr:cytochrome P450 [Amycolatopsis sp.]MCU1681322.1 cytochrome [Amycolatopsis sp.]